MMSNEGLAVDSNRVNGVDCHSLHVNCLCIIVFGKIDEKLNELMIVVGKLSLYVENNADQAFKQLLLAMVMFDFQNSNNLVSHMVETVEKDIIWAVDNDL
jgi:hypothetical protein